MKMYIIIIETSVMLNALLGSSIKGNDGVLCLFCTHCLG